MTPAETIQSFINKFKEFPIGTVVADEQGIVNSRALVFMCHALPKAGKALEFVVKELEFISKYLDEKGRQSIEGEHCSKVLEQIARILGEK